jgi:hypothetical protein
MAKTLALLLRVVLLFIGILGFLPAGAERNAARNVVHLLTAMVALLPGMAAVGLPRNRSLRSLAYLWAACGPRFCCRQRHVVRPE